MAERVGQWARLAARLEVRGGLLSRCGAGGWASLRGSLRTAAQCAVTHGSRGRRPRWLSKVVWGGGGSSQVQALKVGVPCVEFKPFAPQGGAWGCEFSADWGLLWSL